MMFAKSGFMLLMSNIKILAMLGVASAVLYFLFQYGEGRAAMAKQKYVVAAAVESHEAAQRSIASAQRVSAADAASDIEMSELHDHNAILLQRIEGLSETPDETCPHHCSVIPWSDFTDES